MIRLQPRSTQSRSSAASDVYKRQALKRLLTYMKGERLLLILVFLAIIVSSAAGVAGTYLLKPLINGYIVPFIGKENPDLSGFAGLLFLMGSIYICLLYTSPSPRDRTRSRIPSSA